MLSILPAFLPVFLLLSCVSKGEYELIRVQLDATRTALNTRNATCYEQNQACEARIEELSQELDRTREQLGALDERHRQVWKEVETHRERIATLVATCRPECPDDDTETGPPRSTDPGDEDAEQAPPLHPLVEATVEDVEEALALLSQVRYRQSRFEQAHEAIAREFEPLEKEGHLAVLLRGEQTLVRIPTIQVFNEGRDTVSPRGEVLLSQVADILAAHEDLEIQVAAHTDDRPYHTAEHNSAWELGFDLAMTVLRSLEQQGVQATMSAASYAGAQPLASNETPEGRKANRRIELRFHAKGPPRAPDLVPEDPGPEESGPDQESGPGSDDSPTSDPEDPEDPDPGAGSRSTGDAPAGDAG